MIITTQDNKIESWSLIITNATHNHPPTLPGAHPIYRQFVHIGKVKKLVVSQTSIGANNKQIITAIQLGIDEKNLLVKP